ncbi:MAG: hypothetical protein F4246_02255 [Rhodothermaceae bacterium]|nr:hypothetical protein [Rhodothermaceae bacterium]MXX58701.1 hypothetical protein [Rhodothermaceae bacterium]MXZ05733.1 hypothetical protein [Rhodothermaceae bacterium]MYD18183.1 hypothetical protein [Rhodothermaceae bacterium]MYD55818.1 hypothetical protein [Rhodothermaceae bacterium]
MYTISEHYEVVHGKRLLWNRMPRDDWKRAASYGLFLGFCLDTPARKCSLWGASLKKAGIIDWSIERYCVEIEGKGASRTRIKDYWICCGSMADYAKAKNGIIGLNDTLGIGLNDTLAQNVQKTQVIADDSRKQQNAKTQTHRETNKTTRRANNTKQIREMAHVIKLAKEKGYDLHSNSYAESVLDMLQEKNTSI